MYEFYSKSTSTLAEDDIRGMQHIYGVPPNRKYKPDIREKEEEEMPIWGQTAILLDKCNTSYDAIAMIDGEVFAFKRKYMFGPNLNVTEIQSHWGGLPPKLTHVDAVFQTSDRKILFFVNQDVYVLNGAKLERTYKLDDFGFESSVLKIDAIFRKSDNQQVYIFFGNSYYRFDEHKLEVTGKLNRITKTFRDVFNFDTGFTYKDGKTYFFKNENYYEFLNENWVLRRMKPQLSANFFMKCNLPTEEFVVRFGDDIDYIDDQESDFLPEAPNCNDNPEIPCNDKDNGTAKKTYTITLFVLISSSFLV